MSKCEATREQFRKDALDAWTHYQTTILHATAEEADKWLATLEAGEDATPEMSRLSGRNGSYWTGRVCTPFQFPRVEMQKAPSTSKSCRWSSASG